VSWFRSSRRRLSEREGGAEPEPQGGDGDGAAEVAAPVVLVPRAQLEGRPLADLHAYAREHSVPRYRLLRREELVQALSGSGPAEVATEVEEAPPAPPLPPPEVEVSEVTEASIDLLETVQHLVRQLSSTARAPGARELEEVVSASGTHLLVARVGGKPVGMLTLAMFRIPTGLQAWIEDVVVDERARGRGAGEALTREAVRIAAEAGARKVDLTSRREREAAHRLYRKLGFEPRDSTVYRIEP
jgi:GNAT superfamily N-acetyltransferase